MTEPSPLAAPLEVFVDIESGGLRPEDRPWEIAMLRVLNGVATPYVWHVHDFAPSKCDPKALELGGFYDRHPAHYILNKQNPLADMLPTGEQRETHPVYSLNGPDPDVAVQYAGWALPEAVIALQVERLIRGAVVWACNPVYDVPRLEAMLNRNYRAWTAHYRPMCATTWAAATATAHGLTRAAPPFSNAGIGEALGVDRDGYGTAHTGLADCYYAKALVDAARALTPTPAVTGT